MHHPVTRHQKEETAVPGSSGRPFEQAVQPQQCGKKPLDGLEALKEHPLSAGMTWWLYTAISQAN